MVNILSANQKGFKKIKSGCNYMDNKIIYASFGSFDQKIKNDKLYLGKIYKSKQIDFYSFWGQTAANT